LATNTIPLIPLTQDKTVISLQRGRYRIDVIGGWGVERGNFSISFKNMDSGYSIVSKKAFWPVQLIRFGKRAKRAFLIDVPIGGDYELEFRHLASLRVRYNNLPITSRWESIIPHSEISLYFY
jgi:hypothetical protein